MTRIFGEVEDWFHRRAPQPHYHQPDSPAPEAPMTLAIVQAIEDEAHALGHEISDTLHGVLSKHLTVSNMLAHAGQYAAAVEASPVAQALERFALGPAGEATVASIVADVAGLLQGAPVGPVVPAVVNLHAGDVPEQ